MKTVIYQHAVGRFIQRWFPELSITEARMAMYYLLSRASVQKEKTTKGDVIWSYEDIRFVMKYDTGLGKHRSFQAVRASCVTVLPPIEDMYMEPEEPWQNPPLPGPDPTPGPTPDRVDLSKPFNVDSLSPKQLDDVAYRVRAYNKELGRRLEKARDADDQLKGSLIEEKKKVLEDIAAIQVKRDHKPIPKKSPFGP